MRPFTIVLRPTLDWSRLTREEYRAHSRDFCRSIGRPADQMNELVDLWDVSFRISYFETRQRMKDLAISNLTKVRNAHLVDIGAFAVADACAICFVDDDDWFAPDLGEHLDLASECDGFIWTHVAVGFLTGPYPLQSWPAGTSELLCYTNNYAVSAEYARAHGIDHVAQHWLADEAFRSLRIRPVPFRLSVANKHPASVVALERHLEGQFTPAKLRDVVATFVRGTRALDERMFDGIEWARPLIAAAGNHFEQVLASA
jgi:hypothetical protein